MCFACIGYVHADHSMIVYQASWEEGEKFSPSPWRFGPPGALLSLKKYICYMFGNRSDQLNWAYISCIILQQFSNKSDYFLNEWIQ